MSTEFCQRIEGLWGGSAGGCLAPWGFLAFIARPDGTVWRLFRHSPWSTFAPVVRQHNKTMPFSTTEKGSWSWTGYLPSGIFSASPFHWPTCAAHTLNLGYKLSLRSVASARSINALRVT